MSKNKLEKAFVALGAAWLLVAAVPAAAQISLGSAESFGVLAGSAVTNTGGTLVNGDVGVSPGTSISGFPPGTVAGGTLHSGDAVAQTAQTDLTTAYAEILATPCLVDLTGQNLGGLTLSPGVYCFDNSAQLTGALTLDALGDPDAIFIFKIGSTLTTATASTVTVINGGTACNHLFWQVGSSATLGIATAFAGDILALTSITLTTGATSSGRTLARNGAVTLDTNVVNSCPVIGVCPPITVNPATLPDGQVGVLYSQIVSATGGTAPYTFSISSGSLPNGLILDGATGAISGIPLAPGSFSFSITATDAEGCLGTRLYTMIIAPAACPLITVNPATLPDGQVGVLYSQIVSATGGTAPYTFSISSGSLPNGLILDGATGAISGIPLAPGTFSFSITATDAEGCLGTRLYKMIIAAVGCPPIALDPVTLPPAFLFEPYSATVSASGGTPPYTYALMSGELPPGLLLDPITGEIAGVPALTGSYSFTIEATDAEGCVGSRAYTMTILEIVIEEIPTLGDLSLIALAGLLGLAAVVALRRA